MFTNMFTTPSELEIAIKMKEKGYMYEFKSANSSRYFYVKNLSDVAPTLRILFNKEEEYPMETDTIEVIITRLEAKQYRDYQNRMQEDYDRLNEKFKSELDLCKQVWEIQDAVNITAILEFAHDVCVYLSRNSKIDKLLGTEDYSYHPVVYAIIDKLSSLVHRDAYMSEAFSYVMGKYHEAIEAEKEVEE